MRSRFSWTLGALITVACGESTGPRPDPLRVPVIDSVLLFRCDENFPVQIACGLLRQNDSGFWVRAPGSKEFGPIDPAQVVLNQRYVAWAFYRDSRRVWSELCWLPDFGRFCSTTDTFDLADSGSAAVGHWAAIFVLFRPGDWRVIFRGESALGATADSIVMHVDSITTPPPPPVLGSDEGGAVRCASGKRGAVLDGAHRGRGSAPPSTALCTLLPRASRPARRPAATP